MENVLFRARKVSIVKMRLEESRIRRQFYARTGRVKLQISFAKRQAALAAVMSLCLHMFGFYLACMSRYSVVGMCGRRAWTRTQGIWKGREQKKTSNPCIYRRHETCMSSTGRFLRCA